MVPVNVCMYMYVCVLPYSVDILFKMFPVLEANIFLLIRSSIATAFTQITLKGIFC